ncbi:MAG TPA: hypothetical protein VF593_03880 [Chthoniobacteraceae bacterium]
MITCPQCSDAYNGVLRECPTCGSPRPEQRVQERRCGTISYVCLWFARITLMVGMFVSIYSGVVALIHGSHLIGFGCIALAPVYWGVSAAIGLAIQYADSP